MNNLQKLFQKKNKLIVGLMSGTSADGVDAVLLRVEGNGVKTKLKQLAFTTVKYPQGFKEFLLRNSNADTARLDNIARLNILIGEYFANAAKKVVRLAGKKLSEINLIGSHGQTIAHFPEPHRMFGKKISSTLQIGDPSIIAKRTHVVTVGDFRAADMAVGGSGAPLVPYVDYVLFRSAKKHRALLNIGGIANITILPCKCSLRDVIAFDTGPGNMIIDALMQRLFKKPFDRDGSTASRGEIIPSVLRWLMQHPYLHQRPPKSTGREMFGENIVQQILRRARGKPKEDIIATATAFTALAVYDAYVRFIRPATQSLRTTGRRRIKIDELLVSGGGVHNQAIMDYLRRLFEGVRVEKVESAGISSDAKEALCFALLANETIMGNPANVPGATGARHPTVLGKICLP